MMTIGLNRKDLAGQRIMAGFEGLHLNDDLKFLIEKIRVNGIILFKRNIETPGQVKNLTYEAQIFAKECGLPELFIAIDQEGGTVSRLKEPFTQFPEGALGINTAFEAENFAKVTAYELKSIGVNMNMAPVLDIDPEGFNGIMKKRSYGNTPGKVTELGIKVMKTLEEHSVLSVIKHFPGIGSTVLDSHFELPVLSKSFEELMDYELIPFISAMEEGASAVMVSHILYESLDKKWPASLSPVVIKELLREKLGFQGVVITDDLDMKAVKCDIRTSVKQCLLSDTDIPLICNSIERVGEAFDEILKNITDNNSLREAGLKSVDRINNLKKNLSL